MIDNKYEWKVKANEVTWFWADISSNKKKQTHQQEVSECGMMLSDDSCRRRIIWFAAEIWRD